MKDEKHSCKLRYGIKNGLKGLIILLQMIQPLHMMEQFRMIVPGNTTHVMYVSLHQPHLLCHTVDPEASVDVRVKLKLLTIRTITTISFCHHPHPSPI
jgi:hypothetical protein